MPSRTLDRRLAGLGLLLVAACFGESGSGRLQQQAGGAHGAVVATVDGAAIGSDDVRALAEATGLSPREALLRLEEAKLVEQHARQKGYGADAQVARQRKRALVQALLAITVEKEVRPELISVEQVRARFEQVRAANGIAADAFAQHEAAIRTQLTTELRKVALDKLLDTLKGQSDVKLDEAQVQKRLADRALWGGST